jgi:hypothetical protein
LAALVGVLALALAAWIAWRGTSSPLAGREEFLLVDLSDSLRRSRPSLAQEVTSLLRAQAQARGIEPEEQVWIAYAQGLCEQRGLKVTSALAELGGGASELARALEWVERNKAASGESRISIWSDGGFTGPDPRPVIERLRADGIGLRWLSPEPETLPEVRISALHAPREAASGERIVAQVELACFGSGSVTLESQLNAGSHSLSELRMNVEARAGVVLSLRLDCGTMPAEACALTVRIAGVSSETCRRRIALRTERTALHLGGAPLCASLRWLEGDLSQQLENLDVLVTSKAQPDVELAPALRRFVAGGGIWLQFASPTQGLCAPELREEFAALELRPPEGKAREWVALLDASGSMSGDRWSHLRAAMSALERIKPEETRLTARCFAARLEPALDHLPSEALGGPTALIESLETLLRESGPARSVLVISDGEDRLGETGLERARRLGEEHAGELTVIGIGGKSRLGQSVLAALAGPNARVLEGGDLSRDGAALLAALSGTVHSGLWSREPAGVLAESGTRMAALEIREHAAALPVREARVLARLDTQSALLAERPIGLGQVLSVACEPDSAQGAQASDWLASLCQPRERTASLPLLVHEQGSFAIEDASGLELGGAHVVWTERRGTRVQRALSPLPGGRTGWLETDPALLSQAESPSMELADGRWLPLDWPLALEPEARADRASLKPTERQDAPGEARRGRQARTLAVQILLAVAVAGLALAGLGGFFHSRSGRAQAR